MSGLHPQLMETRRLTERSVRQDVHAWVTDDIVARATQNEAFRREVVTGEHSQVIVMTIPPGGENGEEVHDRVDSLV